MSGLSLADQLKALSAASQSQALDPESAYTSLDSLPTKQGGGENGIDPNEGKEHYLDVGPSRLRMQLNDDASAGGTLRGEKYAGVTKGRVRIFDDDEDEEEDAIGDENRPFGAVDDDEEDEEDDDDEEDEDEDDDEDEDEDEEEDEDDDEEEEEEEEEEEDVPRKSTANGGTSGKTLDPVASLRDSRLKDIEKGRGIRRQKALFESLLTLRITFQKALSSSTAIPPTLPADPAGEIAQKRLDILKSLGDLNERMFTLRESLNLSGTGLSEGAGAEEKAAAALGQRKRKRDDEGDSSSAEYWMQSSHQSLGLSDTAHPQMLPILSKWSSKIQAASLQLGSKQAGGSKFLQTIKSGAGSVVEAIETGLTNKRDSEKSLMDNEESSYRALLREVIESRSGSSGPAADLTHLRREKKKKREAERGGSKGRKLRYTVHEKAQNFIVPIPLRGGWHEEQVDELFSSLFGGVGMKGAVAENRVEVDAGVDGEGLSGLGGLRVF
ncbi:hypothetical protein IAU59_001956 [Kwoniella sp. CBS 9459]